MKTRRIHRSVRWLLTPCLLLSVILTLAGPARAASYAVSNLNDSGKGSLRQAIWDATASPGADTITFGVSGTILLSSTLGAGDPAGLTIDGTGRSITISGNEAVRVMSVGGVLTLRNLTITAGYEEYSFAAGIENQGMLTVIDCTFSGNQTIGDWGGALDNYGGTLTVTGSTFLGNTAVSGAAISNSGTMTVIGSTFSSNQAYLGGGAISNGGTMTVTGSTFSSNGAQQAGGAIENYGTLEVTDSTLEGNGYGVLVGGGIYNDYDATLSVRDSTFSGNHAGLLGGGIANFGRVSVTDSTFSDNSVNGEGGGILNYSGTLDVTNSTFSGNSSWSGGGGISSGGYYRSGSTVNVTNSTFSENNADNGGIFNNGTLSTLTLKNTIVASSSGVNCINSSGSLVDGGGNLSWPDTTCPGLNADPLLGPLQDNGGPTQTQALLPGSPAIDAAVLANCPATDQRGVSRPQGAGCDIGAFELGVTSTYNFSGFFQPVDNLPTFNVVQAGVGVPVRFSLGGDQGLDIFAAGYPVSAKIACGGAPQDAIEETVIVGASSLSYDAASDTYTYLWKTNKAWANTCRQLNIRLNDGTEHKANFKFVK